MQKQRGRNAFLPQTAISREPQETAAEPVDQDMYGHSATFRLRQRGDKALSHGVGAEDVRRKPNAEFGLADGSQHFRICGVTTEKLRRHSARRCWLSRNAADRRFEIGKVHILGTFTRRPDRQRIGPHKSARASTHSVYAEAEIKEGA